MKSLPLYLGATLLVAAIAGAGYTLFGDRLPFAIGPPPAPAPVEVAPVPQVEAPEAAPEMSPVQVAAQDEEDVMAILLKQIEESPKEITPAWLAEFCQSIADEAGLKAFWDEIIAQGQTLDGQRTASQKETKAGLSQNPLFFVFEARELIYSGTPTAQGLRAQAPGLLAMAVYRSWKKSVDDAEERSRVKRRPTELVAKTAPAPETPVEPSVDDEVKTSYLKEMFKCYEALESLTTKAGGAPGQYMDDVVRLHEAAIVDRHFTVVRLTEEARQLYSGIGASSLPATVAIGRCKNQVDESLLALGKIYVDASLAERAFRGKQQQYADLGFRALAMVYQRSKSGEALRIMRESNRIQRYNLWQLARLSWKQAKQAAAERRVDEADDLYFQSKQRYLQCLSRLERSKRPVVLDEYRRLQAEIAEWTRTRGSSRGKPAAASGKG